jgi:hypothetical protein
MKKSLHLLFCTIFITYVLFIIRVTNDIDNTAAAAKITYFEYNIFEEPFKYFYFKNIDDQYKNFYWQEVGDNSEIELIESFYFDDKQFYTVLETRKIKT